MTETTNQGPSRGAAREWAIRIGLVAASLLFALLVAEGLSRIFVPISDLRENVALDGTRIEDFTQAGASYYQISNEYRALTTITDKGHRVPAVEGDPEIVFIGDSFTFGFGLSDDETFVSLYCRRKAVSCANLGLPGSGTLEQMDRLESFLARFDWRPREVRLFVFAMSGSFSNGNDFRDNYDRVLRLRKIAAGTAPAAVDDPRRQGGVAERLIGLQATLLRHSNLLRLLKFYAGPMLKSLMVADPGAERMTEALDATRKGLQRLDELSHIAGFEYEIYLIVPVQDILRNTQAETLAALDSVSPKPAITTAGLFAESPTKFYFAFDGHLNPEGSRRVADFLAARHATEP